MREALKRGSRYIMDGLSLHFYTSFREEGYSATQFDEASWFAVLQKAWLMEGLVTKHSTIMDKYDPEKYVGLIVDEWGTWYPVEPGTNPGFLYQQNTLRDALVAALTLNIFNQHCDRVRMANIAQTINVLQAMILTQEEQMILTPTYHVFDMYKVHQDATLLPLDLACGQYEFDAEVMPAVSASASRDQAGQVHLTLCNVNPHQDVVLSCALRGMNASTVTGRLLTAETINAHNTFEQPETVRPTSFDGATLDNGGLSIALPAKSVVVLALR